MTVWILAAPFISSALLLSQPLLGHSLGELSAWTLANLPFTRGRASARVFLHWYLIFFWPSVIARVLLSRFCLRNPHMQQRQQLA